MPDPRQKKDEFEKHIRKKRKMNKKSEALEARKMIDKLDISHKHGSAAISFHTLAVQDFLYVLSSFHPLSILIIEMGYRFAA
jgi:UDP-2,3-diacylglucosamine pyrophosphatase LpxH